jgi:prepilin-type N-terminal cleavage/methylation domain
VNRRRADAGFTLLEIVIAMSIGLLLLAALTSSYVAMRRSARLARDLGLTQDAARDTVLIVERSLRLAGYLPAPTSIRDPEPIFHAPWLAVQGGHGTPPFHGASAARGSGDWLAVSYAGDFVQNRSCLGDKVGRHQIVLNLFYLGRADADSAGTLRCATAITHFDDAAGPSQPVDLNRSEPLVDGVVGLRVLYGVDDATERSDTLPPTRYTTGTGSACSNCNSTSPHRSETVTQPPAC